MTSTLTIIQTALGKPSQHFIPACCSECEVGSHLSGIVRIRQAAMTPLAFLVRFTVRPIICPNVGQLVMVSAGERAEQPTERGADKKTSRREG